MGITFVNVKVSNAAKPKKTATHEFLVDSGAIYTVLPRSVLKGLGIKPTRKEDFLLANGETVRKSVGHALFEFEGKVGAASVVFGEEGIFLLGSTALEEMGFMLDPFSRELKALPKLLMTHKKVHAR